jgi:transposase
MATLDLASPAPVAQPVQSIRVDDIPLLLHILVLMGVPASIDRAYTPHGNHSGLSVGWLVTLWLVYIVSESDHRLELVRDWVAQRRPALETLIGQPISETDFTDDRLGDAARYLSDAVVWTAIEMAVSRTTIRVYNLATDLVRLDATVGQVAHDPAHHPLFQVGRTKAGDYAAQFKLMLGALDPLGLPLAVDVVAGDCADDPLYLPAYHRIRQTLDKAGVLYVGDCKMGALATRAPIQVGADFYLLPLALVGETPAELTAQLQRLAAKEVTLTPIYLPEDVTAAAPQPPDPALALAEGFETTIQRSAEIVVAGQPQTVTWTERLLCVRSKAFAAAEQQALERRVQQAVAELTALTPPPGRGQRQFQAAEPLQAAVAAIVTRRAVADLLDITLARQETVRQVRGYRGQPGRTETTVRYQVQVCVKLAALAAAKQRLGWRLYATNAPVARLSLTQAVLAYRDQYLVERTFARLHGRVLGVTPLYLQRDDHALGLIRILTLALRVMVAVEFAVRRRLAQEQITVAGLYPSQPQRRAARPRAETLLRAFRDITLTIVRTADGHVHRHLTPLTPVQTTILGLLDGTPALYTVLCSAP